MMSVIDSAFPTSKTPEQPEEGPQAKALQASGCASYAAWLANHPNLAHRYPEEEYEDVLRAVTAATGFPANRVLIAASVAEALEWVTEVFAHQVSYVVSATCPYATMLAQQAKLRGIACLAKASSGPQAGPTENKSVTLLQQSRPVCRLIAAEPGQTSIPTATDDVPTLWLLPTSGASPLPPVVGLSNSAELVRYMRTVAEPFHIPTPVLGQMLAWVGQQAPSLARWQEAAQAECAAQPLQDAVYPPVLALQPYVPGKGIRTMSRLLGLPPEAFSKLASNEHPFGARQEVLSRLAQMLADFEHAPPTPAQLHARLSQDLVRSLSASWSDISPAHLAIGGGSVALIKALMKACIDGPQQVLSPQMPFAMYPFEVAKRGGTFAQVPLAAGYQTDVAAFCEAMATGQYAVVFLANPRNPLGTALVSLDPILAALQPHQVLVLDEAYVDFIRFEMPDYPDGVDLVARHPDKNIVVLRTFSKSHALAAFRLGYAVARPDLIARLTAVLPPLAADPLSVAAGVAALETPGGEAWMAEAARFVAAEKQRFYQVFDALGLPYVRSWANFIFFETQASGQTGSHTGQTLFDTMAAKGVIIRPMPGACARVSIGNADENNAFLAALQQVYAR